MKRLTVKLFVLFLVTYVTTGQADMMKCVTQRAPQIVNYFDAKDKKQRKKCLTSPKKLTTSATKKQRDANAAAAKVALAKPLMAAKDVKPMACSSAGGSVKVNGRVFHLDPDALCKKYSTPETKQAETKHVKLAKVDKQFRRQIAGYVNKVARQYQMEPAFIHAIISAESGYKPNATSPVGAMGMMQLMPFTAERFGVSNAYDPYQNIRAGTRYLKLLYDEFGSLELAAAGYNAGEGAVRKYKRSIPPYKETRAYVPKVMAYYRRYKSNRALIVTK